MAQFTGSTVIVTGAGSGIGLATAKQFLAEGARVVAADISAERLDALKAEHPDVVTVAGDIASQAGVDAVMAAAGGTVDVLANVAGIMDKFLPLAELDDATWERVISVNLDGPMRLARAVLPGMVERGKGAIVNVSSEAGLKASASGTAYTVSKHAVLGLTKSIAFFYGPQGVRCNAVLPGAVATNIEAPFASQYAAERVGPFMQTNIPGAGQPEQEAAAIVWLASDEASFVNGALLPVDGGWSVA